MGEGEGPGGRAGLGEGLTDLRDFVRPSSAPAKWCGPAERSRLNGQQACCRHLGKAARNAVAIAR